jgi:hypothetical protein
MTRRAVKRPLNTERGVNVVKVIVEAFGIFEPSR